MNEAKHTPGPWRIYDMSLPSRKVVIIQPDICEIKQKNRRNKYYALQQLDEETQANARLIAAAPELLEALHTDLKRVNELSSMIPEQAGMWDMWARDIQNAIVKAGEEGERNE